MPAILLPYLSQSNDNWDFARLNVESDASTSTASDSPRFVLCRLNEDDRKMPLILAGMAVVGRDRPWP